MNDFEATDYIIIVHHHMTESKNSNLNLLQEAIDEKKVPLQYKEYVKKGVEDRIKKFEYKMYAKFKKKNSAFKFCNQQISDTYFRGYENGLIIDGKQDRIGLLKFNSTEIIKNIPNPNKTSSYKIKGLVIGQIQSGKTANIQALVCRAVDFGYRFIIVLSGRTNSLRLQTQQRFDNEVVANNNWSKLTDETRDFTSGTMDMDTNLEKPKIAIVKKNVKVLERLMKEITKHSNIRKHPVLIIDDECDDASIDTNANKEDTDPSKTNKNIRDLLGLFDQAVYVGFSATPFANVFIDANSQDDLYPEDFIFLLDTPKNYTGTEELVRASEDIFKIVDTDIIEESDYPKELEEAVHSFILSCCVIKASDKSLKSYSMLVHPSYRIHDQDIYKKNTEQIMLKLGQFIEHPNKYPGLRSDFEDLFQEDFSQDTDSTFEEIWTHHKEIIKKVEIKKLNNESTDELNYKEEGEVYIIIGGNILSRGLTIEGLVTTFFTREPKTPNYDTLIQMQRWCGFRKSYAHLTRIYTTENLKKCLIDLVTIEKDFREDIKKIYDNEKEGKTPIEIQAKIKEHPAMRVTNSRKKGNSILKTMEKKYRPIETLEFFNDKDILKANIRSVREWVKDKDFSKPHHLRFEFECDQEEIMELVESYHFSSPEKKSRIEKLIQHFSDRGKWTVIIHSPENVKNPEVFKYKDGIEVQKINRGLRLKGKYLKIVALKHKIPQKIKKTKKLILYVYVINEKSNEDGYRGESKIDKSLKAPAPIIGLYFITPVEHIATTADKYFTQDRDRG